MLRLCGGYEESTVSVGGQKLVGPVSIYGDKSRSDGIAISEGQ